MTRRRLLAAVALVTMVVTGAAPGFATDVTVPELTALADATAGGDDAARAELTGVTSVEGRSFPGATLLDGDPADVDQRLRTLAALDASDMTLDTDAARATAASILAGPEYQRAEPAPPGWLQRVSEWLAGLIPEELGEILSSPALWILAAVIGLGTLLVLLGRNVVRRRRIASAPSDERLVVARRTAGDLETRARRAAASGDYGTAVRLWFEAGALRLAERGVVPHDTTSTSGAIRRAVPTATMVRLTTTFDRVAYGRRPATADDAQAAEHGWTTVVTELRADG